MPESPVFQAAKDTIPDDVIRDEKKRLSLEPFTGCTTPLTELADIPLTAISSVQNCRYYSISGIFFNEQCTFRHLFYLLHNFCNICYLPHHKNLITKPSITMANETGTQATANVSNLAESITKLGQMQVEIVKNVLNASMTAFQSVNKLSLDVAGNVADALNQALKNISASTGSKTQA